VQVHETGQHCEIVGDAMIGLCQGQGWDVVNVLHVTPGRVIT